jgi:hypothetical protein
MKCTTEDLVGSGEPYKKCFKMNPNGQCVSYAHYRQDTYEFGFNVRHWLSANHEHLLKETVIDDWKNTYQREVLVGSKRGETHKAAEDSFWSTIAKSGRELKYDLFLEKEDAKPWALLTLRPEEPEGSAKRISLKSVDKSRCFEVPSFQPATITKDADLQIFVQAGIASCDSFGGFRGKAFLQGELSIDATEVNGTLITGVDFEDPSPINFYGRPSPEESTSTRGLFACCAAPSVDRGFELDAEMSVSKLYKLLPANQDELHTDIMKDITDAALALYPKEWIDVLKMSSVVEGRTVPTYMQDLVKDAKVTAALQDVVTAQVAPEIWSGSVAADWGPVGATQQEIKDRAQYYMQAMDGTALAANPAFTKAFQHAKAHHLGKLTPGLSRYVNGEGGKSACEWAHALADHVTNDMDNCMALLMTDPRDGVQLKIFDIISALSAGSSEKDDKELPLKFLKKMNTGLFHFCRQIVGGMPGGASDMQDVIVRAMKELKRNSEDSAVSEDVRGAIKVAFASLPSSEEDFAKSLAQFFTEKAKENVYFSDRLAAWTAKLKSEYPAHATKHFNRVSNFSAYLMQSVSSGIALFALSTKPSVSWSEYDDKDKCIKFGVDLSIYVLSTLKTSASEHSVVKTRSPPDEPLQLILETRGYDAVADAGTFANQVERGNAYYRTLANGEMVLRSQDLSEELSEMSSAFPIDAAEAQAGGFGRGCLNWVAGTRASLGACITCSFLMLATSVLELVLMKNLSRVEKNLLQAEAIISSCSLALSTGTFIADVVAGTTQVVGTTLGIALGAVSWVLLLAAVVIEVIFLVVHNKSHKSVSDYVKEVGVPLLKPVNKPSQKWLDDHALPALSRR